MTKAIIIYSPVLGRYESNVDADAEEIECEHTVTHIEQEDFGYADPIKCDWVDDIQDVEVCDNCGAWYNELYEMWENE